MKHGTLRRLSSLLLAFVMAYSLAVPAVAAEEDQTVPGDPDPAEAMPMTVGDTQTLTAKAEGAGTDETVTWLWSVESGSDAVSLDGATDQSTATIQAKAAGQATVKATATAGDKTGSVSWQVRPSCWAYPRPDSTSCGRAMRWTAFSINRRTIIRVIWLSTRSSRSRLSIT